MAFVKKMWGSYFMFLLVGITHATTDNQATLNSGGANGPPNMGNFALPAPQQPGPLISFGQTLIGRNHLQVEADSFGNFPGNGVFQNLNASMIFVVRHATAIYFNYPIHVYY